MSAARAFRPLARHAPVATLLLPAVLLAVALLWAVPLAAQRSDLLEDKEREMGGRVGKPRIISPYKPEEMIPLEGRVDPQRYILGPGDEVDVSIFGGEDYVSYYMFITAEGRVLVPPVGPIEVAGLTLAAGEELVQRRLREYIHEGEISLTLLNPRRIRVFAAGAVNSPGTYVMRSIDRVSNLVQAAGGVRLGGSLRRIRLLDPDRRLLAEVDIYRHYVTGDLAADPFLPDGCIVEIPPQGQFVVLRGKFPNLLERDTVNVTVGQREILNEYQVELLEGETLGDLLELSGAPQLPLNGDSLCMELYPAGSDNLRRNPASNPLRYPLDRLPLDHRLSPGEAFEFPSARSFVYLTGNVNRPGRYLYQPGWTVHEYLGQAGGPAYLGADRKSFLKRADGSRIKCSPQDQVLPGDEIYIPAKTPFDRYFTLITAFGTTIIYIISR